jgi:hypothetical protein
MLMDFCYDMQMDFCDICVDEIVGHIFLLIDFMDLCYFCSKIYDGFIIYG